MKLAKIADPRFQMGVKKLSEQVLPFKTAFKLKGIIKKIEESATHYEEVRRSNLEKLCERSEDGGLKLDEKNNAVFTQENLQKFNQQMSELGEVEVEMPTIKVDDLGDDVKFSTEDLYAIEDLLQE